MYFANKTARLGMMCRQLRMCCKMMLQLRALLGRGLSQGVECHEMLDVRRRSHGKEKRRKGASAQSFPQEAQALREVGEDGAVRHVELRCYFAGRETVKETGEKKFWLRGIQRLDLLAQFGR